MGEPFLNHVHFDVPDLPAEEARYLAEGFAVAARFAYVDGAETRFGDAGAIADVGYVIDNTTKTRAIFEINKGSNVAPEIDVNAKVPHADRRVPFQNMIYVADGPSDVPVFSVVNQFGGKTFAVYRPGSKLAFQQVNELQRQDRIDSFGEANYTAGSQASMWITNAVEEIADRICADRERALGEKVGRAPQHLHD